MVQAWAVSVNSGAKKQDSASFQLSDYFRKGDFADRMREFLLIPDIVET